MKTADLETPALLLDLDRVERNISHLQQYCTSQGLSLRPHIKTHKIPLLAHWQMAAGASGLTCQKLGEAEVMAAAGLDNLLITFNIVGETKLERLIRLARTLKQLTVTADHPVVVAGLGLAARRVGLELRVLVECDTGYGRTGVQTPQEAVALARTIDRTDGTQFEGLMTYPTRPETAEWFATTCRLLREAGLPPQVVSGGGTVRALQTHEIPEITELRAGNYIFNDRTTVALGGATFDDCAQQVLATVVSRPTATRFILDAGSKTLTTDPLVIKSESQGYGYIMEYPEARIYSLSEEHAWCDATDATAVPAIGERVRIIVNHCCVVTNMFDQAVAHRSGDIYAIWPIAARGKVQ